MENTRVVITGLGTVNALAWNVADFAAALLAGRCGIGPVTLFDTSGQTTHTGAEIKDYPGAGLCFRRFKTKRMSRADLLALDAALQALTDAGLFPLPDEVRRDLGLSIGGGAGGLLEAEEFFRRFLADGEKLTARRRRFSKLAPAYSWSTADHLASLFDLKGPRTTFMTACSSGGTALGWARDLIRSGQAAVLLAGGTEPLCRMTFTAFNALRAVDPDYCKPFDRRRRGLSLGEGAAFMVMESLEHAQQRGARIQAEFLGYGLSADAYHMTAPDPAGDGAARAMRAALSDAGLEPEQVDYINAHGTGTPANDVTETKAIKTVFGPWAFRIPVSSTKSMIGHCLGAAGALEALASILALEHGFLPPTIHLEEPDPECDLDYVADGARKADLGIVLSNSFAFGGNNTTIILGRGPEH
ncbi:MAG: beta-ketoacyl-[acyl-carrier-protein] synthase family protein [Thermodesulfobacteriota bacterium]